MALAIVYSRASFGVHAPLVTVEVHISNGTVGLDIVGLPEAAVKESRHRVRSALMNTHFEFPCRRILINLAPADLPKEGGRFDLPIALGILAASEQLPREIFSQYEFTGELALSGELRSVRGVLPMALAAYKTNRQLIVPAANSAEAALVQKTTVWCAQHLLDVCAHLKNEKKLPACSFTAKQKSSLIALDLADVKGQPQAKRALEIAAAGRHSMLLIGPPGTGKTMLASRLPGILPELDDEQALETAALTSISHQGFDAGQWKRVPFRAPHHTCSNAALVGGGRPPKPGEISLSHHGVLFLDELPEFQRHVLECLREPLESGCITVSRAGYQTIFPARFQFIAAMNPCPCGYAGSLTDQCHCSDVRMKHYMGKISGPLLDRIDMHVACARVAPEILSEANNLSESSDQIRQRVLQARRLQINRQKKLNTELTVAELDLFANINKHARPLLHQLTTKFNLSARVYHRMIKLARTIADIAEAELIEEMHLAEALNYRCLDKTKMI
jgi:magnesium chelatase family protein